MVPVLLIIFNRPDKTERLMEALAKARPPVLYVSADGPRANVPSDADRCAEARRIATSPSWPCEVRTRFLDENVGCKAGVSSAITWFFSQVDRGIILEDDCVPSSAFFPFTEAMLERYSGDERIMHIGGTAFLDRSELADPSAPYRFSKISHIWGWATWKRAWDRYDIEMRDIDRLGDRLVAEGAFLKPSHARFWTNLFRHVRDKRIDTWDAQWAYTVLSNRGLAIIPSENLVENIGFDGDATHTRAKNKLARPAFSGPLALDPAPNDIAQDTASDVRLMEKAFVRSALARILDRMRSVLKR